MFVDALVYQMSTNSLFRVLYNIGQINSWCLSHCLTGHFGAYIMQVSSAMEPQEAGVEQWISFNEGTGLPYTWDSDPSVLFECDCESKCDSLFFVR